MWEDREVLLEMFLRSCEDPRAILWWKGMGESRRGGKEDKIYRIGESRLR
jgi:hypothetical protein